MFYQVCHPGVLQDNADLAERGMRKPDRTRNVFVDRGLLVRLDRYSLRSKSLWPFQGSKNFGETVSRNQMAWRFSLQTKGILQGRSGTHRHGAARGRTGHRSASAMKSRRFAQSGREESTTRLGKAFALRRQTIGRIRLSVSRRVIVVGYLAAAGSRR